jgi:hypothetical protein
MQLRYSKWGTSRPSGQPCRVMDSTRSAGLSATVNRGALFSRHHPSGNQFYAWLPEEEPSFPSPRGRGGQYLQQGSR